MPEREERERVDPRISINSLAEYMTASAARRATIVRNQKRPPDFLVARYTDAEEAITQYLAADERNLDILYYSQEIMIGKLAKAGTEWDAQRLQLCCDAVESFAENIDAFDIDGAVFTPQPERGGKKLILSGVEVSLRPELSFVIETRNGPQSGLVKLYFRKNDPLTAIQAQYVGAAMYSWGTTVAPQSPPLQPTRCLVYDVFGGLSFEGPRAFKKRMTDLEAACEEIALRWPHL